ncbi:MAG TPA: wax ester/triacylglycerol synthase domain-containing protein [Desertimonas sp.]|nr:wax ester/triacylglycerol synthase domain-containing protein [Desertimonas sp.]
MADQPSRVLVADRQMSDAEALMWRVEKDPFLASTFGAVTILDRPPDFDRLRARMESAVHAVARLGWRVQPIPTGLGTPMWADDPDFDIDLHVRRVALPAPGTLRQLLDLATVFVLDPLDRTRPLWQFLVVEGLANGKAALITKMHHTITDGVNGIRMSMQYFDLSRNATEPAGGTVSAQQAAPLPPPTPVDSALSYVHATFRLPISIARQVGELLADPTAIPAAGSAAVDGIRGALTQLSDSDAARSPLWTNRSMRRRLELARAPLASTKAAAKRLGGSINVAFLTAVAEAAHHYHVIKGSPIDELRASMAVSTRTKDSGANAFGLVKLLVPTGEMSIAERFGRIAEATTAIKAGGPASMDALAVITSALPTSLLTRVARQQAQTVDFATSNLRTSPVPTYIAGAKALQTYAVGPLGGVAFNITMLSYVKHLDMGIHIDAAAVADPALLARLVEEAFGRLRRAR